MLTPPQVAKLLGVNPDKVRAWIGHGRTKSHRHDPRARPRYRIAEADFEAFKQARAVVARPPLGPRHRKRPDDLPDYWGMIVRGERIVF